MLFFGFYMYFCSKILNYKLSNVNCKVNFDQLIEIREARKTTEIRTPYGYFYRSLINGKYYNFLDFHDELTDSLSFTKAVQAEYEAVSKIHDRHQLRFSPNEGDADISAIAVDIGYYITIGQLLTENPAIVAQNSFLNNVLEEMFQFVSKLNAQGIYHLCFAPDNVLVRKSDHTVCLLNHASFYLKTDVNSLFAGDSSFIAPEVFTDMEADDRSEVYAMGKFVEWLYQTSGLPLEWKHIVTKATNVEPKLRYSSVDEMWKSMKHLTAMRRTGTLGVAALAIALAILGLFIYMLPSPDPVEFVQPVKELIPDEMVDDDALLGIGADLDSAAIAQIVANEKRRMDSLGIDKHDMRAYNAKAEAIFRKQFTKAADEILDKVYTGDKMNMSEKEFLVRSKQMTEELAKKKQELAKASSLSNGRSQQIASEIIEKLTDKKVKALDKDYMGLKTVPEEYKKPTSQPSYSSSLDAAYPSTTTTTTTPSTTNSSQSKSNQDIYKQHRDRYGVDPYDPVDPENYQLRKK